MPGAAVGAKIRADYESGKAFFPLLHLDHIYYKGRVEVMNVELVRTRQALMASDHLPLVADLRLTY